MFLPVRSRWCPGSCALRPRGRGAFSLVEVVLAVGIASTALLVVFSLTPLGLSSLQEAQRQLVETEIYNKIGAELRATTLYQDPSKAVNLLGTYCDSSRFPAYFDVEGNELSPAQATPSRAVFTVRCARGAPTADSWSPAGGGELLYGTVRIGFHQDPRLADTATVKARQRTFLLSNHGS